MLVGIGAVASPIVLTGHETLSLVALAGLILAPVGLVVIAIAAASFDPKRTTVHGTFGGEEATETRAHGPSPQAANPYLANPRAPVRCLNCRTMVTYDLARCPRCAEDRPCRACGRPLTMVDDQVTCPNCRRPEVFCNCSHFGAPIQRGGVARLARGR